MQKQDVAKLAFRFVLIIGIVNFFADMTYEGGRGIAGPFLGALGASATIVGFVAGFGELVGYGLRSISGYFADKTHRYWAVSFIGYAINMLAVPALALAGSWPLAATLIVAERTGRAIRRPAVEAMLSEAGRSIGHGWVFGLNEALDQTGATIGPLIAALVLYRRGVYRNAFGLLLVPAVMCLATLVVAWLLHGRARETEKGSAAQRSAAKNFPRAYWLYVAAGALVAAGFADFSLIAFHFQKTASVPQAVVPVFYAAAMATGAITSLAFGKFLDRFGLPVVLLAFGLPAFFAVLAFQRGMIAELMGTILWGVGMGAQDSCLKAVLSAVAPAKRGTAFGLFDTCFGIAWFAGSAIMGLLYDKSIAALMVFSVVLQIVALPVFVLAKKEEAQA